MPATAIDPFAEQISLAIRYQREGEFGQAEEYYRQILGKEPNHLEANHLLGVLLYKTHYYQLAIEYLEKTVEIKKSHMPGLFNLARCQRSLGRFDESIETMKQYIRLGQKKKSAETARNLGAGCLHVGLVFMELRNYEEAERWLLRGLRYDRDSTGTYNSLCLLYYDQGDTEAAEKMALRAIGSNPGNVMPYRYLAASRKFSERDDLMREMERLYAKPGLADSDRLILAFALGKANEDLGEYDDAFSYWAEGNRLRRKISPYVLETTIRRMEAIKKTFSANFLRTAARAETAGVTPVFIVGMPRSGTSLAEQVLASHSSVTAAGELETLGELALEADRAFPENISKFSAEQWRRLGAEYLERVIGITGDTAYIVDKMPRNFMFTGMIRMMLPQAKIIHCRRNRMDTALSCYKNDLLQTGMGYTWDLTDLGTYYRNYESLMRHWQELLPGWIHDVHYEDIVADTEKEIHRLLDFCGLEHQESCVSFYRTKRIVQTASALQVRRPVYKDSIDKWENYRRHLQPLIEALESPPDRGFGALRKKLGF